MSEEIAISVRDVSKKYRLFSSPKERLKEALHPFRKQYHKEFWALKDVSFDIPKGQTLGILGRNGSGKSTLLQIIASVLQPTSGSVEVNGRVSALLELGAGFNPEFTGRDNVILNGAIQGISRDEMETRMPEIEAFADIGEFFDQPVKTYSSGMFVRVAFASVINVDPDILIVDEALAVGDAKFQNKCFQQFHEFQAKGKTIIFVTHAMETVTRLCDYAVLLEQGQAVEMGAPNDVANMYFKTLFGNGEKSNLIDPSLENIPEAASASAIDSNNAKNELEIFLEEIPEADNCINRRSYNKNEVRTGDKRAEIVDYVCVFGNDFDLVEIKSGGTLEIYMKVIFHQPLQFPVYGFSIKTIDGIKICGTNTYVDRMDLPPVSAGEVAIFRYGIKMNLVRGDFFITLAVSDGVNGQYDMADHRTDLIYIYVQNDKYGDGLIEPDATSQVISQSPIQGNIS